MSITTENGTTVSLVHDGEETFVSLDNPDAPAFLNPAFAGSIIHKDGGTGFHPTIRGDVAMRPDVLRAIATLIEQEWQ